MRAAWLVARSHVRRHRAGLAAVSALAGLALAATVGSLAAAVRTGSSLVRALDEARYPQGLVDVGKADPALVQRVRSLPEVADAASGAFVAVRPAGSDLVAGLDVVGVLPLDDRAFTRIARPRLALGRLPDPHRADEVALNPDLADRLGVTVGDDVAFESYTQEEAFEIFTSADHVDPTGRRIRARVVGIGESINEITSDDTEGFGVVLLSPAVFDALHASRFDFEDPVPLDVGFFRIFLQVLTREPEPDMERLLDDIFDIYDGAATNSFSEQRSIIFADARDTVAVESAALLAVALVAAIAGLLAVGQAGSRQVAASAVDNGGVLRAIGATRRERGLTSFIPVAGAIFVGALVGIAAAAASSSLMPIGLAGELEPDPGVRLDAGALLGAGSGYLVLLLVPAAFASWFRSSRRPPRPQRSALTARTSSPSLSAGIGFASTRGSGHSTVPLRAGVAAAVIAVAGVVGALTFGDSLDTLVQTPRLYGAPWDLQIPLQVEGEQISEQQLPQLLDDERIEAVSRYQGVELKVEGGGRISGSVLDHQKGFLAPTVLDGRLPSAGEIAIGAEEAELRHLALGDRVVLGAGDRSLTVSVVGRLPATAFTGFVISPETAETFDDRYFDEVGLLLKLTPAASVSEVSRDLRRSFAEVYPPTPPPEVANLAGVRGFPYVTAAFLAMLGLTGMAHLLVTSVRRRARDLAVLKVIGFARLQVRATIVVQALVVALIGLALGVPLGIALGRSSWSLVADGLLVVDHPTFPFDVLWLVASAVVVAAVVVALIPADRAARLSPALVLQAE